MCMQIKTSTTDMVRQSFQTLAILLMAALAASAARKSRTVTTVGDVEEAAAREWIDGEFVTGMQSNFTAYARALWNYNVNMSHETSTALSEETTRRTMFMQKYKALIDSFDWRNFSDRNLSRVFAMLSDIGLSSLPSSDVRRAESLRSTMQRIYSVATVCRRPADIGTGKSELCYELQPGGLSQIMTDSRDWDELLWAWIGWRNVTGSIIRPLYKEFCSWINKAAVTNGYQDNGEYWRAHYEIRDFEVEMERLWLQVRPLYQQLHAYVRRRLKRVYRAHADEFPKSRHIPAHLLGNMWAQSWTGINDLVTPYPNVSLPDITKSLVAQKYTTKRMFTMAEEFFTSIGLDPMPDTFWTRSMLEKPTDGRKVVCHASAWDFLDGTDFRIKQCTEITSEYVMTTHHEMGHVQYYMNYRRQPIIYRHGANPAFHEAVGDTIALSVMTPDHLRKINLLTDFTDNKELDINYLLSQALEKVAFIPFGYVVDKWRWDVFSGKTSTDKYNTDWWKLRCRIQGVAPPVERSERDFDPGSKYHIPNNTPYIRYFISFVIQFQFQKALCNAANHTGPLHRCDIYQSRPAGDLLRRMLELGRSRPWPEVMETITGYPDMDAGALLEYFKPLYDWLRRENEGHETTWSDECPSGSFAPADVEEKKSEEEIYEGVAYPQAVDHGVWRPYSSSVDQLCSLPVWIAVFFSIAVRLVSSRILSDRRINSANLL